MHFHQVVLILKPSTETNPADVMKNPTNKINGPFARCIQKAFDEVHAQTGISKEDLFAAAMAFASIGLIVVNIDFLPLALHFVGWTAIFCGGTGMLFLRRIL